METSNWEEIPFRFVQFERGFLLKRPQRQPFDMQHIYEKNPDTLNPGTIK